jgi:hypothetical protein
MAAWLGRGRRTQSAWAHSTAINRTFRHLARVWRSRSASMSVTSWLVREHLAVGTFPRLLWRVIAGRPAALITAMGVTLEDLLAAVEGGDRETRVWVRGHELIHGTYEGRPHEALLGLADEARAISTEPGMGSGSIRTGRAQILAIQGRKAEARAALAEAAEMAERLSARVTGETVSLFGGPEYCLRHTESLVYTHLGDRRKAEAAQDRALACRRRSAPR